MRFKTLPVVFASMGPVGNFVGFIWFFMLFLAAITSSLSMLQPALAFLEESLGIDRKKGTLGLLALGCLGNLFVLYYSQGLMALDTIDFWVGTFLIFVLAAVQIICFGWVFGIERGWKEAHQGAQIRIPGFYRIIMKYVAPAYLLIVFGAFCWNNLADWIKVILDNPARQLAAGLILAVTIFLMICVRIGEKRWRAMGLDIDNKIPLAD